MDITIQAASGAISVTGFPDGPPVKAGPAIADFLSGTHLYGAILTALYERERTGRGGLVEVAMIETMFPTSPRTSALITIIRAALGRTGNRHAALASRRTMSTLQGRLVRHHLHQRRPLARPRRPPWARTARRRFRLPPTPPRRAHGGDRRGRRTWAANLTRPRNLRRRRQTPACPRPRCAIPMKGSRTCT